jgi:hypothetical protein
MLEKIAITPFLTICGTLGVNLVGVLCLGSLDENHSPNTSVTSKIEMNDIQKIDQSLSKDGS